MKMICASSRSSFFASSSLHSGASLVTHAGHWPWKESSLPQSVREVACLNASLLEMQKHQRLQLQEGEQNQMAHHQKPRDHMQVMLRLVCLLQEWPQVHWHQLC